MENNTTLYSLWEKYQKICKFTDNLKVAYCKAMADKAYAYAEYMTYRLNKDLEGEAYQYKYDGAEDAFLLKVIRPIYPTVPKSPASVIEPKIEVQIKYKNGKTKQIIKPITAFKIFVNPEKIDPSEYKF